MSWRGSYVRSWLWLSVKSRVETLVKRRMPVNVVRSTWKREGRLGKLKLRLKRRIPKDWRLLTHLKSHRSPKMGWTWHKIVKKAVTSLMLIKLKTRSGNSKPSRNKNKKKRRPSSDSKHRMMMTFRLAAACKVRLSTDKTKCWTSCSSQSRTRRPVSFCRPSGTWLRMICLPDRSQRL